MNAFAAPLLEVKGVSRRFGGLAALDRVTFKVARGDVVGLIGPNGSGKTTLLNIVSGRLAANGGSVRFVPADAKPRPADTAYEVYSPYNRPYAGPCPPPPPARGPAPESR